MVSSTSARRCFPGRPRVYTRGIFSCTRAATLFRPVTGIYARNLYLYPRGDTFPAGHGYIRGKSSPVPARRCFPGRSRVYTREIFTCTRAAMLSRPVTGIYAGNLYLYPRGDAFPAGHGYIRGKSLPVPARRCFPGRSRVYTREIFTCTRAAALFRPVTGIYAGNLYLYPRGDAFPAGHGYIRAESLPVPARRHFSGRPRVYPREIFSCTRAAMLSRPVTGIYAGNLYLYPRGDAFPAGHGYIRGKSLPVPARRCFPGRSRVYTREIFTCTRAAMLSRPVTGIYAGNLYLYPRGGTFPAGHGYIRGKSLPVPARRHFSGRPRVYTRGIFTCTRAASLFRPATGISARNLYLYPRGDAFPAGHGYIRAESSPVPARWHFSGQLRVYPQEIFTCTRAASLSRPATGIYARNLYLYPRGGTFPAGHGYIRGKSLPVPADIYLSIPEVHKHRSHFIRSVDFGPGSVNSINCFCMRVPV